MKQLSREESTCFMFPLKPDADHKRPQRCRHQPIGILYWNENVPVAFWINAMCILTVAGKTSRLLVNKSQYPCLYTYALSYGLMGTHLLVVIYYLYITTLCYVLMEMFLFVFDDFLYSYSMWSLNIDIEISWRCWSIFVKYTWKIEFAHLGWGHSTFVHLNLLLQVMLLI